MTFAPVAIYGATGYCGELIARELQTIGHPIVLAGRDEAALRALAASLSAAECRTVMIDDAEGLRQLCAEVGAIVNTAGPFSKTTEPVVKAAIAGRADYLDISGEQRPIRWTMEQAAPASDAGVALLPCIGFQPALCDLVVALAASEMSDVAEIDVAYAIKSWRPSGGTVAARLETLVDPVLLQYDNGIVDLRRTPPTRFFDFPAPIGARRVMRYPAADALTIPRHLAVRRVSTYMTTSTLAPAHLERFVPGLTRWTGRALRSPARALVERTVVARWGGSHQRYQDDPTTFEITARLSGSAGARTAVVSGRGIFDICGPLTARIAGRVADPSFDRSGVVSAPHIVEAEDFLNGLAAHGVTYSIGPIEEPNALTEAAAANA
jgi:short subunit dehydrogenase-like uncharacterized protein